MSSPTKGAGWSDAEKVAVLLSIIRSAGLQPKWNQIPLPVGRTAGATAKMYEKIRNSADAVPMNQPDAVPAARKMAPRGGKAPTVGRGNGRKTPARNSTESDDEDVFGSKGAANGVGKRKRGGDGGGKTGGKKAKVVSDEEIAGSDNDATPKGLKKEDVSSAGEGVGADGNAF